MLSIVLFRLSYDRIYSLYKDKVPKKKDVRTPEGLLYLAGVALKEGHDVHIVDGYAEDLSPDEILDQVSSLKPDVVGCGGTTPEFTLANKWLKAIKEQTGCVAVVGGPHVSAIPEATLVENHHIDYVVCGEGEYTFRDLLRSIDAQSDVSKVKGIAYIDNGAPHRTASREPITNLDELPSPAWHLVSMDKYYFPDPNSGNKNMASIITSRGCPFNCTFCYSMHGRKIRYRSPKPVVDEIEYLKNTYGTDYFFFHDETFTFHRTRTLEILQDIIDRKLNIEWTCMTRADSLAEEVVAKMAESGCTRASLGIESGSQKILNSVKKKSNLPAIKKAYNLLSKNGIEGRGSLIIGLPGETAETIRETIDFVKSLNVKVAAFNIVTPYPGTVLYNMTKDGKGIHFMSDDWQDFRRWGNAVAYTDDLSCEDLIKWQKRATIEFYTQPKMILYYVKKWFTLKYPEYYLRPFRNSIKQRVACMLKGDLKLKHL